jgi:hypothetical protein
LSARANVTYYIKAVYNLNNTATTLTDELYIQYNVVPEFPNFALLLLILTVGTALTMVTAKTKKGKSF